MKCSILHKPGRGVLDLYRYSEKEVINWLTKHVDIGIEQSFIFYGNL